MRSYLRDDEIPAGNLENAMPILSQERYLPRQELRTVIARSGTATDLTITVTCDPLERTHFFPGCG